MRNDDDYSGPDAMDLLARVRRMLETCPVDAGGQPAIKDILIREGEPIRGNTPHGLVLLRGNRGKSETDWSGVDQRTSSGGEDDADYFEPWRPEEMMLFFDLIDPAWPVKIVAGAIDRPLALDSGRYRANLFTYNGEWSADPERVDCTGRLAMCIRVFSRSIPSLSDLKLPSVAAEVANARSGMILLTGPTGAGKSTTAAALLHHVNSTRSGHIITVENPNEIMHESRSCVVSQREVGSNVDSMARGVFDAMRESPVAILIGEIRDADAADAALYAGESGHLVLGTVHSNSCIGCLAKMISFFTASEEARAESLAQSLRTVIAQILVPTVDERSWSPIFEVIVLDSTTRELVAKRDWQKLQDLLRRGDHSNLISLNHSLAKAVREDKISHDTAFHYSYDRDHLISLIGDRRP